MWKARAVRQGAGAVGRPSELEWNYARAHRVGECQIHVVAPEQDVVAHRDALEHQLTVLLAHRDQREVRRAAADAVCGAAPRCADVRAASGGDGTGRPGPRGPRQAPGHTNENAALSGSQGRFVKSQVLNRPVRGSGS